MANQGDAGLAPDDFHIIHLVSELGTTPGLKDSGEIFGAWDFCRQVLQDSLNGEESVFLFLWVHNSVSTAKQEMAADAHPVKSYILNMNPSLADTAKDTFSCILVTIKHSLPWASLPIFLYQWKHLRFFLLTFDSEGKLK